MLLVCEAEKGKCALREGGSALLANRALAESVAESLGEKQCKACVEGRKIWRNWLKGFAFGMKWRKKWCKSGNTII